MVEAKKKPSKFYIHKNYEQWGLKNKILFAVFVLTAVMVLFFTYVSLSIFQKKMDDKNESFYEQSIGNVISHLEDYFDEIGSVANEVNYNYYLQNYLHEMAQDSNSSYSDFSSSANMRDYELAMQIFSSALNDRTDITSIMVFGKKRLLLYRSIYTYYSIIMDYTACNWYSEAVENTGHAVVTGPQQHEFITGNTGKKLSISRTIHDSTDGSFIGVILVDINVNQIQEFLNEISTEDGGRICIANQDGEFICEQPVTSENPVSMRDKKTQQVIMSKIADQKDGTAIFTLSNEKYQVVYRTMEDSRWKVLAITPYKIYQSMTFDNVRDIMILFSLLMLIILFGLNRLLSKVVAPVRKLKDTVDLADAGNLDIRATVESKDEIGQLAGSFNDMLDRIENLKEQVVEEQEEKRKMELQALQAQINPHFLYNTLDAIIWMAETNDPGIVPMTEALANLFRISLNKGKEFIRVSGEMSHVENYLIIQSMRYQNKFSYQMHIDKEVEELLTIKLIIQPIVENCIYHGIKPKRGSSVIEVTAYKESAYLIIQIKDDGVGMNQEKCEQILQSNAAFANSSGSGIGIKNVNERIKLRFGMNYGLHYESKLGEGTIVTVTLPVIEKEEILEEKWQ